MGTNNFTVKSGGGKYTILDKEYKKLINEVLNKTDEDILERWELYNLIITELIQMNKEKYFKEIKYRLTDGENPNSVILDIINRDNNTYDLIGVLKNKIEGYLEEDFYRRFYE